MSRDFYFNNRFSKKNNNNKKNQCPMSLLYFTGYAACYEAKRHVTFLSGHVTASSSLNFFLPVEIPKQTKHGGLWRAAEPAGRWERRQRGGQGTRQTDAGYLRPQPLTAPGGGPGVHVLLGIRWDLNTSSSTLKCLLWRFRTSIKKRIYVNTVLLPAVTHVMLIKCFVIIYIYKVWSCSFLVPGSYFCYDNPAALQTQVIRVIQTLHLYSCAMNASKSH